MKEKNNQMTINKRWEEEFVEKGAEIEHERWAKWQKYVHKNLYNIAEQEPERWKELKNPHLKILPTELYERWERQINTPYSELSEQEKESDRKEARNYLPLVKLIESQAYQRAVEEIGKSKDDAYHERDMLVCALSKLFPSYLARHDEKEEWEDDWRWIVYIEIPTGQVSWHIHDSEREMFNHLEVKENNWDGHNTERKYQRLSKLQALKGEEIK